MIKKEHFKNYHMEFRGYAGDCSYHPVFSSDLRTGLPAK